MRIERQEAAITTIAYKKGILAADTRISTENEIDISEFRKVFRLKNGVLIGFAGEVGRIQKTINALRRNPDDITVIKGTRGGNELEALLVGHDGSISHFDGSNWFEVNAEYYAIGSGDTHAIVAMYMGASAKKAISVAMHFDKNTGGSIRTVKLK